MNPFVCQTTKFFFGCGGRISFGVFLLWWAVVHSTEGINCRNLYFNQEISGKRLYNHVVDTKNTSTEDFCQGLCYLNDKCVSINFNQTQDENGKHSCELNDSDEESHPEDLEKKDGFSYRGSKMPCTSNPCKGSAICRQTGSYPDEVHCVCPAGFTGKTCNEALGLLFPTGRDTDYVTCPNCTVPSLQAFTVCFWICTNDTSGRLLTLFSYFKTDNDIIGGIDKNSLVLYVDAKRFDKTSLQKPVTDGAWHHICFTWKNSSGLWQIYKDGVRTILSEDPRTDRVVAGGGVVILGQEQDKLGGDFDSTQAFIGELSLVNLWDHVISSAKISQMSKACTTDEGNVIKWSDFMSGIKGNVAIIKPSYCKTATVKDEGSEGT